MSPLYGWLHTVQFTVWWGQVRDFRHSPRLRRIFKNFPTPGKTHTLWFQGKLNYTTREMCWCFHAWVKVVDRQIWQIWRFSRCSRLFFFFCFAFLSFRKTLSESLFNVSNCQSWGRQWALNDTDNLGLKTSIAGENTQVRAAVWQQDDSI